MTDSADEYDVYFHPLGEGDLKEFDDLCDKFTAIESPSKASTSRAKPPEPEETNTSETDEIDVPPSAEPSMSPDRTTKSSGRQPRPRKSTPSKRSSARSSSPLDVRSSRCPNPRRSLTKTKPLLLRSSSPDKAERSTAPTHESKPPLAETAAPVPVPSASLLKLFRPKGRFSVTDLVTPSWCEYKFDYSLRGQRWRGANMDEVVVSKHGKAIPVQKTVVIHADKVMKQGQARHVHKKLEDALPVVEVIVKVKTAEERFALRLLNMIAHFQMLIDIGTCREFHVMGFINGYYVTGIIDEINRLPAPETASSPLAKHSPRFRSPPPQTPSPSPRKRKTRATVEDSSQRKIDSYFSPSKGAVSKSRRLDLTGSPAGVISINSDVDDDSDVEMKRASQESKDEATVAGPPSSTPPEVEMRSANASQESGSPSASQIADQIGGDRSTYRLHLNDTKTRSVNSMPKDDLSGRLQLMLYHQLLGQLVGAARLPPTTSSGTSSSPLSFTFSFSAIMEHLHLISSRTFSDEFIVEATELLDSFDAFSASSQKSSQGSQEKKDGSQGSSVGSRLVTNLDELVQCWYSTVRRLRLQLDAPIDGELELIYRMREEVRTRTKGKGKGKTKSGDKQASFGAKEAPLRLTTLDQMVSPTQEAMSPEALDVTEEQMYQHAILESLKSHVRDSQSSNGTEFYTPFESPSQDPDYKPPGTIDLGDDSGKAKVPDSLPLPTPPPSSSRLAPADATGSSSTSESRAPSPRGEKDEIALQNEAVEDHIADVVSASQGSDMDWEALFEDIPDELVAALEIPATSLSPVKKNQVQEEGSKRKGKEKATPIDTTSVSENSKIKPVAAITTNGDAGVIGSKKFSFDRELLTKQIVAAIEFWESKREPRGVDLEDTWKCDTCEFREGCEWREAKAAELLRSRPAK
ncbi:hypothetical protein FRC04_006095 [Tulasnella sp. 424]|nr:hypothetical protein FRC04_006095 [Tulasnella sp. 424]KAG8964711.1 hypothetical protein FRC05_003610 [Tulasnella sp. 425]